MKSVLQLLVGLTIFIAFFIFLYNLKNNQYKENVKVYICTQNKVVRYYSTSDPKTLILDLDSIGTCTSKTISYGRYSRTKDILFPVKRSVRY